MNILGQWDFPTLLVMVPFCFAMCMAASKTTGLPFLIATIQIVALTCICQFFAWSQFHLTLTPVLVLAFLFAGAVCGRLIRSRDKKRNLERSNKVHLALKERELKEAHLQLVKQDEADRRILASDLHDQVLNDLKILSAAVSKLSQIEPLTDKDAVSKQISDINKLIDSTTAQVREVMENLTPSVLENLGLASALDDLLRRSGQRGKFKVRFKDEITTAPVSLSKIEELLLFRTVQETLSNTVKHADASKVEITLSRSGNDFVIAIQDDGRGIPEDKERGQSRGLRYMRQRADLMGATIVWSAAANNRIKKDGQKYNGCLVKITLPLGEQV